MQVVRHENKCIIVNSDLGMSTLNIFFMVLKLFQIYGRDIINEHNRRIFRGDFKNINVGFYNFDHKHGRIEVST